MRIGVIGGGAAAVVFLDALLRVGPSRGTVVTVYEPRSAIAVGRPYDEDGDEALLNRPVVEMTTSHTEPGVFARWVGEAVAGGGLPQIKADARFQPRWLYGRHLQDRFRQDVERLGARGAEVGVRGTAVMDVRAVQAAGTGTGTAYVVTTEDGASERHDALVLCVGTPAPADVYGLHGAPGFIEDAYPLPENIDPDLSVLVLGCGLTAVDIVRGLLQRGHRGPVRMASRRGLLPCVRSLAEPVHEDSLERLAKVVHETPPDLLWAEVLRQLRAELLLHGADPTEIEQDLRLDEDHLTRLRRQLARADDATCWRGLADTLLAPIGEKLWYTLPAQDRRDFLARYDTVANTMVNPMPPVTAESFVRWIEEGRLAVVRGIRDVVRAPGGGFTMTTDADAAAGVDVATDGDTDSDTGTGTGTDGDGGGGGRHFDLVCNAVRPTPYDSRSTPGRLLARLVEQRLARENEFGGVHIDFETNRVLGDSAGLFALGHPTAGDLYHANVSSLTGMSMRAQAVVHAIHRLP